jgi:hypothetical protein
VQCIEITFVRHIHPSFHALVHRLVIHLQLKRQMSDFGDDWGSCARIKYKYTHAHMQILPRALVEAVYGHALLKVGTA